MSTHAAARRVPLARASLPPTAWLALGVAATALAGMRWNVALVAWVAMVPWLVFLRRTTGWRSRLLLLAAVQVGTLVQVLKIVTEPLPWFFAPMYSVPMALGSGALFLGFEAMRRRLGDGWGLVLLPALVVVSEWVASHGSQLGSWGAAAYTQIDDLPLMQTAALVGLSGIGLLVGATNALVAVLIDSPTPRRTWGATVLVGSLILGAYGYGVVRLSRSVPGPLVTVAAVVTDVGLDGGGLPPADELARATDALFDRSARAADAGAELIVWNEGATAVDADEEPALVARGEAFSAARGVDLVLAYVVPLDGMRRFENKYVWLTPDGRAQTYHKRHPVPGEGSEPGTGPVEVLDRPYGRVGGAICYDYDFPALGMEHARLGAGLVAVPASDWRGIDPYHTQMAAVRGIEGGFSVVRPVRWATSGVFDAFGRARGTMSWFEDDERVLIARVPATRVPTLYSRIGDVLPAGGALVLAAALLVLLARRRSGPAR